MGHGLPDLLTDAAVLRINAACGVSEDIPAGESRWMRRRVCVVGAAGGQVDWDPVGVHFGGLAAVEKRPCECGPGALRIRGSAVAQTIDASRSWHRAAGAGDAAR